MFHKSCRLFFLHSAITFHIVSRFSILGRAIWIPAKVRIAIEELIKKENIRVDCFLQKLGGRTESTFIWAGYFRNVSGCKWYPPGKRSVLYLFWNI